MTIRSLNFISINPSISSLYLIEFFCGLFWGHVKVEFTAKRFGPVGNGRFNFRPSARRENLRRLIFLAQLYTQSRPAINHGKFFERHGAHIREL